MPAAVSLALLHAVGRAVAIAADPAPQSSAQWSGSASGYYYAVPREDDFMLAVAQVKRDTLHLEARYNYEALDTGSLWAGHTFSGGDTLAWQLTPMAGAVLGKTRGIAPGLEASLAWRKLDVYVEAEYVVDLDDNSDSFFYSWNELGYTPRPWLRLGFVTQRTRVYRQDRDIAPGLFAQVSLGRATLGAYFFNPGSSDAVTSLSVAVRF
jgi:hypothetical protein